MGKKFQASLGTSRAVLGHRQGLALPEHSSPFLRCAEQVRALPARQRGFTLMELIVVMTLVGLLAVGVVLSLDGVGDDAQVRLTRVEMTELRKALQLFRRDVGHFPDALDDHHAEDLKLDLLFGCQDLSPAQADYDAGCKAYNLDTARGWNGPYVLAEKQKNSVTNLDEKGLFDAWGNRYRLFDEDSAAPGAGAARIVSYGANRAYEGDGTDICSPNGASSDDLVLCLVQ